MWRSKKYLWFGRFNFSASMNAGKTCLKHLAIFVSDVASQFCTALVRYFPFGHHSGASRNI
jgi:hypothetical protein